MILNINILNESNKMKPTPSQSNEESNLVALTSEVISAYVSNNPIPSAELPSLIKEVYGSLSDIKSANGPSPELVPAVDPKDSITDDYIICLEDGKKFKSLKRHLTAHFKMSPAEYREKWGLPLDYPMVAPNYSKKRSSLAREKGLGRKRKAA